MINPHFRSIRRRADHLISAIKIWYNYCSRERLPKPWHHNTNIILAGTTSQKSWSSPSPSGSGTMSVRTASTNVSNKTPSTPYTWNMDHVDVNRSVFTTVYSTDFESTVRDMTEGRIGTMEAARRLEEMKSKLLEPVVSRRPIPGTLPGDRNMYLGIVALAILGSPPCGLTVSDSLAMDLPFPVDSTDLIVISKSRLILVLTSLNLLPQRIEEREHSDLVGMINLLWRNALGGDDGFDLSLNDHGNGNGTSDLETASSGGGLGPEDAGDEVELGLLKLSLYGVTLKQPSWFGRLCRPCGVARADELPPRLTSPRKPHPKMSKMRRSNADLVRHDVATCPMCCDVTGCPAADYNELGTPENREVYPPPRNYTTQEESETRNPGDEIPDLQHEIELEMLPKTHTT